MSARFHFGQRVQYSQYAFLSGIAKEQRLGTVVYEPRRPRCYFPDGRPIETVYVKRDGCIGFGVWHVSFWEPARQEEASDAAR